MMHMTFYWGINVTILFDQWRVSTWLGYILSLVALLLAAAFYQYLEDIRIRLKIRAKSKIDQSQPSISIPLLGTSNSVRDASALFRLAASTMFGVNSAIGYMLMLAVMSFNGGVLIAVVVGLAVGYYCFRSAGEDDVVALETSCACA